MPAMLDGTTLALEDALMVDDAKKRRLTRRKSGCGGRGSATQSNETQAGARGDAVSRAGSKKKPAAFCKAPHRKRGHCADPSSTEHDVVREQTRRYKEGVQAAGKGHTLGPPQIWAWRGLIAGLQKQGAAVGAANAATLTGYLKQLDGVDTKCDHARFCRVDRTYQSEQARITLAVDRSGVRDPVVSALQQLGAARKYGRAPPTQLSRELQQWLDTLLDK